MLDKIVPNMEIRFEEVIDLAKDTVFITGSRAEGLGNKFSDVDLHIVSDACDNPLGDWFPILIPTDLGFYVELRIYHHEQMRQLSSKINQMSPDDFDEVHSVTFGDLDLYYRTAIGEPIVNPQVFRALQSEFNKEVHAKVHEVRNGLACQAVLAQVEMALQDNDVEAAYFLVQEALGYAVDSILAAHGENYVSWRWRFEKLARAFGTSSDIYQKALRFRSLGEADFIEFIQQGTQFCQDLGMGRFSKTQIDTPRIRQMPHVRIIEALDRFYMVQDEVYIYELSPEARYLWGLLDGLHTETDLISHLSIVFGLEPEHAASLTAETLRTFLMYGLAIRF